MKKSKLALVPTEQAPLPHLATLVGVAVAQAASRAVDNALTALQESLLMQGFGDNTVDDAGCLACWETMQHAVEGVVRDAWTMHALAAERAMRDAGENPEEVAGLKAPEGTLFS